VYEALLIGFVLKTRRLSLMLMAFGDRMSSTLQITLQQTTGLSLATNCSGN
jgi:hypothetical protein